MPRTDGFLQIFSFQQKSLCYAWRYGTTKMFDDSATATQFAPMPTFCAIQPKTQLNDSLGSFALQPQVFLFTRPIYNGNKPDIQIVIGSSIKQIQIVATIYKLILQWKFVLLCCCRNAQRQIRYPQVFCAHIRLGSSIKQIQIVTAICKLILQWKFVLLCCCRNAQRQIRYPQVFCAHIRLGSSIKQIQIVATICKLTFQTAFIATRKPPLTLVVQQNVNCIANVFCGISISLSKVTNAIFSNRHSN